MIIVAILPTGPQLDHMHLKFQTAFATLSNEDWDSFFADVDLIVTRYMDARKDVAGIGEQWDNRRKVKP